MLNMYLPCTAVYHPRTKPSPPPPPPYLKNVIDYFIWYQIHVEGPNKIINYILQNQPFHYHFNIVSSCDN